jgi:hypothetical protein
LASKNRNPKKSPKKKKSTEKTVLFKGKLAERAGFEPAWDCSQTDFELFEGKFL